MRAFRREHRCQLPCHCIYHQSAHPSNHGFRHRRSVAESGVVGDGHQVRHAVTVRVDTRDRNDGKLTAQCVRTKGGLRRGRFETGGPDRPGCLHFGHPHLRWGFVRAVFFGFAPVIQHLAGSQRLFCHQRGTQPWAHHDGDDYPPDVRFGSSHLRHRRDCVARAYRFGAARCSGRCSFAVLDVWED